VFFAPLGHTIDAMRAAVLSLAVVVSSLAAPVVAGAAGPAAVAAPSACAEPIRILDAARQASPFGVLESCPGVRPGAVLRIPSLHALCTFNAMFQGSDGARYMATAGHCVLEGTNVTEKVWPPGKGPEAQDAAGHRIGEFAYAILKDPKDISLIRLDRGVAANPQMCHFGGPTRIDSATSGPVVIDHFGQGLALGGLVPARTQVALNLTDPDHIDAVGLAAPGDSGSLVESADGGALGVLVTTGLSAGITPGGPDLGNIGITRFAPQLARATDMTHVRYTLVPAPLL
jgi:hypothetical protein